MVRKLHTVLLEKHLKNYFVTKFQQSYEFDFSERVAQIFRIRCFYALEGIDIEKAFFYQKVKVCLQHPM